jgi:hypothetical protein
MIIPPKEEQIEVTRKNIYKIRYDARNKDFRASIMNCRYPTSDRITSRTTAATLPIHDKTSHYRTALEYIASYLEFNMASRKKKVHVRDNRLIKDWRTGKLIKP